MSTSDTHHSASDDLSTRLAEYRELIARFDSLLMATCNGQGVPEASYAPYLAVEGDYYIYISDLAQHTANLRSQVQCSVLFIEDEQDAKNLFARRRVKFTCTATEIERDSEQFAVIMEQCVQRFGNFMQLLRTLNDFRLFQLCPQQGNYVAGFGQAYQISGAHMDTLTWRKENRNEQTE